MDPLSDVLSLLKLHSYACGGFDVGADLYLQFPKHAGIKCYAVVSGRGLAFGRGLVDPVRLKAGDCFLLPRGRPFCLASELGLPPVISSRCAGTPKTAPSPPSTAAEILHGRRPLRPAGDHANILLGCFRPLCICSKESDKAVLRWSIERLMEELREPQPGSLLIAQHLAHTMLLQALRLHLADA